MLCSSPCLMNQSISSVFKCTECISFITISYRYLSVFFNQRDTPIPVSISILLLPISCCSCYCYCCCCCATATTTTTTATIVKYFYLLVGFNLLFVNNAPFLEFVFVLVACNTYFCKPNQHTFRKQYYYCYAHTAKLYTFGWVFIIFQFYILSPVG